ncbi:hypothetical protein ElyMa_002527300, partial [Elysia marginata]
IIHGFGSDAHIPEIYCKAPYNCRDDVMDHHVPCKGGGVKVDDGRSQCLVYDVCSLPWEVLIDHTNRVEGECLDDFELRDCQQEMRDNPCPVDFKNASAYNSDNYWSCTHDCCLTNECLFPHFGIHMANSVVSTNPQTNGQSGGDGNSLWEKLRGSCRDTFNLPLCQSLKNDHNLCRSRLSLSMCPETCGICAAVGSTVCQDTTSICPSMKSSDPKFCDTEEAFFECPTTCGKCDQLLESVVLSVLGMTTPGMLQSVVLSVLGMPTPAASPAPTAGVPAVNTTPSPVDCSSITPDDCVHFGPLCETTFLGVVCPAQCDFCSNGEGTSA